jgi:hypothetical protein
MEAAAEGARKAGALTVGVLPGNDHADASSAIDIVLPTGLGIVRNALTARMCHVMVGLPGGSGTLEEMLFAQDFGRPVLSYHSHEYDGFDYAATLGQVREWLVMHMETLNGR